MSPIDDAIRAAVSDALRLERPRLVAEIVGALRREQQMRERWVSRQQAAEQLGVSIASIDRRIADGSILSTRVGRAVRVDSESLRPAADDEIAAAARGARA